MRVTKSVRRQSLLAVLMIALYSTMIGASTAAPFPEVIPLPNGFQPEGIASGKGTTFFVGSIPTGAVYRGNLKSGQVEELVPAQAGRNSIGLKYDARSGLLFVAGGPTGKAFVYDGESGENVAEIQLTNLPSFINDVVITNRAAYFTNSFQPTLYKVSLTRNGKLQAVPTSEEISLGGDYVFTAGAFNANGIEATSDGKTLIIVNSSEGALYKVNPSTGVATRIDLNGDGVPNGDGILLRGKTLYVVQNALNQVAVVKLNSNFKSGEIKSLITSPLFRVPTTIAGFGEKLYVVNARFGTPPTPDTEYEVVRVPDEGEGE
jgi:sugar lactone lactonase YvrE